MEIEQSKSPVSYTELGGISVNMDQFLLKVSELPLDGVLGFLSSLSLQLVQRGDSFTDPRFQGIYLNKALVDDFPESLPGASRMIVPGRVPITGGRHLFIHEQNIAWLSHIAILHAKEGLTTPELDEGLMRRVCRLLLITNDYLNTRKKTEGANLVERREIALHWLRHYQFNKFFQHINPAMIRTARQYVIINDILPKYFNVEPVFIEATGGVSIQRYFEILVLFISHIYSGMRPGIHWLQKDKLFSKLKTNKEEVDLIFNRWICNPESYRHCFEEWITKQPATEYEPYFNYVPLRMKPLIEARPGDFVCPVIPFLLAKVIDEPYFILSDYLMESAEFQQALGKAYHEYAHSLVNRIAQGKDNPWWMKDNIVDKHHGELADSYIQRGDIGIAFEHKGGRQSTKFLCGGSGERLLGPSELTLKKLDIGEDVSYKEGKKYDKGILTKAMWQQSSSGKYLPEWIKKKYGNCPRNIFPVITHLEDIRVDQITRKLYLNPLIEAANLYADQFWEEPQWLHVSDLEALATMAEVDSLNLETIFHYKKNMAPDMSFDVFLIKYFGRKRLDSKLKSKVDELFGTTKEHFWPEIE